MKVRSIFISDVHLGCKYSKAADLTAFLKKFEKIEYLYIIGDFIDGWKLKRRWYWDDDHSFLIRKIIGMIKNHTKVFYIVGNHDEFLKSFVPSVYGSIYVENEVIHTMANGKKFLIVHGDQFDIVVKNSKWLAILGDISYDLLVRATNFTHWFRKNLNMRYWSLSEYLKRNVKKAINFIGSFEQCVTKYSIKKGCNGVICGHIHMPDIQEINNITYCNTGDWVETCSAIVEYSDGSLELFKDQYQWKN